MMLVMQLMLLDAVVMVDASSYSSAFFNIVHVMLMRLQILMVMKHSLDRKIEILLLKQKSQFSAVKETYDIKM